MRFTPSSTLPADFAGYECGLRKPRGPLAQGHQGVPYKTQRPAKPFDHACPVHPDGECDAIEPEPDARPDTKWRSENTRQRTSRAKLYGLLGVRYDERGIAMPTAGLSEADLLERVEVHMSSTAADRAKARAELRGPLSLEQASIAHGISLSVPEPEKVYAGTPRFKPQPVKPKEDWRSPRFRMESSIPADRRDRQVVSVAGGARLVKKVDTGYVRSLDRVITSSLTELLTPAPIMSSAVRGKVGRKTWKQRG